MLNLGTQTASLVNHIQSRAVIGQPEPMLGMACTLLGWTDRYPVTIVVIVGDMITVQEDASIVIEGSQHDGSAVYTYTPNVNGALKTFKRKVGGMWQAVHFNQATKRWRVVKGGMGLRIGERNRYYDPNF